MELEEEAAQREMKAKHFKEFAKYGKYGKYDPKYMKHAYDPKHAMKMKYDPKYYDPKHAMKMKYDPKYSMKYGGLMPSETMPSEKMPSQTQPTERAPAKRIREQLPSEKRMPRTTKGPKASLLRTLGLENWFE